MSGPDDWFDAAEQSAATAAVASGPIDPFKQADDTPKPLAESAKARKTATETETNPDLSNVPAAECEGDSATETETPDLL
jgi:hypothetical protein